MVRAAKEKYSAINPIATSQSLPDKYSLILIYRPRPIVRLTRMDPNFGTFFSFTLKLFMPFQKHLQNIKIQYHSLRPKLL